MIDTRKRLFYLDNLKVFLIILVIAHHAGQPYSGGGWWWYFTTSDSAYFGAFFAVNAAFFMSLFFLISAYFVPASLEKKGLGPFIRERLIRLGIPLVIGFVLLIPFSWPVIHFGHLWFLEHLLIYSVLYAIIQTLIWKNQKNQNQYVHKPFPTQLVIILFTLIVGLLTFVVRIQYPISAWIGFLGIIQTEFAHVPQYMCFFMVGIVAARNNWFTKIPKVVGMTWLLVGVIIALFLYTGNLNSIKTGGLNWGSLGYSMTETFLCSGLCIGLIFLFQLKANKTNKTLQLLSSNAFSIYIFHVPVVVSLQYIVESLPVSAYFKFIIVIVLGVVISFLISHFIIRKIPYLKKIF
ncbi:peptidoglycan/LPS O-acetylase OafA/YrhL [Paenibacillus sp. DS2015]|uniref:acyltransferase family protein n=1 Tax=Paenibacillus sp. DS2015 TaxID=3373917 RepID=UPI003D1943E1